MQGVLPPELRPTSSSIDVAEELLRGCYTLTGDETAASTLPPLYAVKVGDLGCARVASEHYEPGTLNTTMEYRSPEGILGFQEISCATDIWSVACIVFELLTGAYLFDPRARDPPDGDCNVEHIKLFMELLGDPPRKMTRGTGIYVSCYYDENGDFKHGAVSRFSLTERLTQDHCWSQQQAEAVGAFLAPMLRYDPARRATARECLRHPWLDIVEGDAGDPANGAHGAELEEHE